MGQNIPGKGTDRCDCTTETPGGEFVCHGHTSTCADVPYGAPYALFIRDANARLSSCRNYNACRAALNIHDQNCEEMAAQSVFEHFVAPCPGHPPAFVGDFEELFDEYQRFYDTFSLQCKSAGCLKELPTTSANTVAARSSTLV